MNTSSKRGFTLIELLVVIAIIGILSSVVLASLNNARQKSRDARRISDIKQIQLALELYFDASSSYPVATSSLVSTYIASWPKDPNVAAGYAYQSLDSSSAACSSAPCPSYVLMADLEDASHTALQGDVDGTVASTDCADTNGHYCARP